MNNHKTSNHAPNPYPLKRYLEQAKRELEQSEEKEVQSEKRATRLHMLRFPPRRTFEDERRMGGDPLVQYSFAYPDSLQFVDQDTLLDEAR